MTEPVLNEKQKAVFEYVKEQIISKGYPPSVREIGSALGISSSSTVHGYLRQLEKLGCIHRDPAKPRAMAITQEKASIDEPISNDEIKLPILDEIELIKADFSLDKYVASKYDTLANILLNNQGHVNTYIFIMPDDSMINIGIFPGDYLLIKQTEVNNGDIILSRYNNQLTVKTYFKGIRQIRLQPENDQYQPLYLQVEDFNIIGKVCTNIRRLD